MERPKINIVDDVFIKSNAFLLAILGAESRRKFTEAVEQLGLGWQGQNVIASLHKLLEYGPASQKQLADFIGIDSRNLVAIIDTLEQHELVKRMPNPNDRRGYQLQLTAKGQAAANQIQTMRITLETNLVAPLSPAERKTLHELLKKLWTHSDISRGFQVMYHGKKHQNTNIKPANEKEA